MLLKSRWPKKVVCCFKSVSGLFKHFWGKLINSDECMSINPTHCAVTSPVEWWQNKNALWEGFSLQPSCWLLRQLINTRTFISSRGELIFDERKLEVACGLVPAVLNCLPSEESLCSCSSLMCAEGFYDRPSMGGQFAQCMQVWGKGKKRTNY